MGTRFGWAYVLGLSACAHASMHGVSPPAEPPSVTTTTKDQSLIPPYRRADWGGWSDHDRDCQDTRQEVLIASSLEPPTLDAKQCRVKTGRWLDPYTGKVFTDPSALQVDHVLALKEAHYAGGWLWDKNKKHLYANDLNRDHLQVVSASVNQSKGALGPDAWMPPNMNYRCEYLKRRLRVLRRWQLEYDAEHYLDWMLEHCR